MGCWLHREVEETCVEIMVNGGWDIAMAAVIVVEDGSRKSAAAQEEGKGFSAWLWSAMGMGV